MVHVVSLTPHAQKKIQTTLKSENHMQNINGMQNMTPHAKYDTTCMIDERFERPWQ
jgi:hypothetical protein